MSRKRSIPDSVSAGRSRIVPYYRGDRKSTRLNSSHGYISYAVFCLKKKKQIHTPVLQRHSTDPWQLTFHFLFRPNLTFQLLKPACVTGLLTSRHISHLRPDSPGST